LTEATFQSHNGAIAALLAEANLRDGLSFNPTMVRLLPAKIALKAAASK